MPDANLSLAHRYVEAFLGEGRLEVGDEVLSADIAVTTGLSPAGPILGLANYKQIFGEFFAAFPPVEPLAIIDSFEAGDRVVVRFRSRQRHEGTYFGIAPTGRVLLFDETHVMRVKDGRIVENVVSATNLEFEMLMAPVLAPAILGGDE